MKKKFGESQYEAHINLGHMSPYRKEVLPAILEYLRFKTTDIVNVPLEGLEQEDFDTIITTKDSNLKTITERVEASVKFLKSAGYKINRYKVESTVIDSKYEDKFNLL